MASNSDGAYFKQASDALAKALDEYNRNPNVENLVNLYEAQTAVRTAANNADIASLQSKPLNQATLKASLAQLQANEAVPGLRLGLAQQLLTQLRQAMNTGGHTAADNKAYAQAYDSAEQYIKDATARVQADDQHFGDQYSTFTGQPPPEGKFTAGQTIGNSPTPQPNTGAPDEGVRPELQATPGAQLPNSPSYRGAEPPPKRQKGSRQDQGIYIEPLPDYAPWEALQDVKPLGPVGAAGQDVNPGLATPVSADSVEAAQRAAANAVIPQGPKGLFQPGYWFGGNRAAVNSGALVFTGYQTRNTKYIDDQNPRFGSQIVGTKTPTYQSGAALQYALGKEGYPSIAAFQKAFGLSVTDRLNPETLNKWGETIAIASMNTAAGYPTTVQDAMQLQLNAAAQAAARARAAMAAAYNVDPTASAAILGSAMKQITGRLSTAGEDSEFHRAFNSANISTQGKVDAQQFARDWVRNKYPTEAGTQAGQDYYGAMYDVLTAGPGSLGAEAANING